MLKAFVPISKILKASAAAGGRKNERTLIPVQTTVLQLDSSEVAPVALAAKRHAAAGVLGCEKCTRSGRDGCNTRYDLCAERH